MNMSIQKKLVLLTVLPMLIIFIAIFFLTESVVKKSLMEDARLLGRLEAEKGAAIIRDTVATNVEVAEDLPVYIARLIENNAYDSSILKTLADTQLIKQNIVGVGILFMPERIKDPAIRGVIEDGYLSRYWYRNGDVMLTDDVDDPKRQSNYKQAVEKNKAYITDMYTKRIANSVDLQTISIVVPLRVFGEPIGAIMVDLSLDMLNKYATETKPFKTGFTLIISDEGTVVAAEFPDDRGKSIRTMSFIKNYDPNKIADAILDNKQLNFEWYDGFSKKTVFSTLQPIVMGSVGEKWGVMITVHNNSAAEVVGLGDMLIISRLILLAIIIVSGFTIFMNRTMIIKPLQSFTLALKDVTEGEGDLTRQLKISTGDELEQMAGYMNAFLSNLRSLVKELKATSNASLLTAKQLESSANEMEMTFGEQASDINSVASAIEEMSSSAEQVKQTLMSSNDAVHETEEVIADGQKGLKEALNTIENIKKTTESLASTVVHLGESSQKIGDILNVINDIADQTNLLALNAAIEAARAGDAGRGFAVVADEVRKLAERTQRATNEIKEIIDMLQSDSTKASKEMDSAVNSVVVGVQKTNVVASSFEGIAAAVHNITENSDSINIAVQEQTSAIQGVNQNTRALSVSIDNSNNIILKLGQVVQDLSSASEQTGKLLQRFKVD